MCGARLASKAASRSRARCAHPPSNTGAFQNLGIHDEWSAWPASVPQFYADAAVVAYSVPASDVPLESLHAKITASGGRSTPRCLSDGDLEKTTKLPIPRRKARSAWIQYEFPQPQTIRAITYVVGTTTSLDGAMLASEINAGEDPRSQRRRAELPCGRVKLPDGDAPEHTISFPPVTAKYFRVTFKRTPPPPMPDWAEAIDSSSLVRPAAATDYEIAELVLHPGARVNRFEEKAAFVPECRSLRLCDASGCAERCDCQSPTWST